MLASGFDFYDTWQEKQGLLDSLGKCGQELRQRYKGLRDSIRKFPFRKPTVIREVVPDLYTIDSRFLINHIDHVFYQWRISPFACRLSFEEFCKTLLPYRPVRHVPFLYSGDQLYRWFGKFVNQDMTAGADSPFCTLQSQDSGSQGIYRKSADGGRGNR